MTATALTTPHRAPSPAVPRLVAGALYTGAVVVIAAVAAWPVYRSGWYLLLVGASVVLATGIAVVSRLRRWDGWMTAIAVTAAFLVFGVPLAVPSRLGAPLEALRGLGDLLMGTVFAWKDLVTVDLPVGTYRNLLVPALVVFLVGTCATLVLSWRDDRAAYAAAPVGVAMTSFGLFFGRAVTSAPVSIGPITIFAPLETAIGVAVLVASVLWLAWRNRDERIRALRRAAESSGVRVSRRPSTADRRRTALGVGMLAIAVVIGAVVVPWAARGAERDVLRSAVGPELDLAAEVSPLTTYRSEFDDARADNVLFRVAVQHGSPSRVRLATLDNYDGEVFRAGGGGAVDQGRFVRVPSTLDAGAGQDVSMTVAIDSLTGIWMPTTGRLAAITFDGDRASSLADSFYYSASAEAGVETAGDGLETGDAYRLQAVEPVLPDLASLDAPGGVDSSVVAPKSLTEWVQRHATGSGGAALDGLVRLLRERGYLSHALAVGDQTPAWMSELTGYTFQPSASGHSLARIDTLFTRLLERETDPRAEASGNYVAAVGDDEQFAVAVALIARELDFPARVVVGARLSSSDPDLSTCDAGACRAADLSAWTEVQDASGLWVPIDVTPQHASSPSLDVTEQRDPENVTEVRPDSVEEVVPPDPVQEDSGADDTSPKDAGLDLAWLWPTLRATGVVAAILVLALGPFLAIVAAKGFRRRGRRTQGAPVARIAGGWDEYVDAAIDAGRGAPKASTRGELAAGFATTSGAALAEGADRAVFSGGVATADEAEEFWRIVDAERRGLSAESGFWRRVRAAVSLRSFIRHLAPTAGFRERTAERGQRRAARRERTSP
ncbi:transglutaminaseTgpA domain-containing protein [Microbacterium sp. B2969]|uniref:TransglutaminaseTgpA domain-containing protein n=1 Tax=Microbacterium alkaliflavum TaxID=3248839 RepID=A0ABW7QBA2_9MICO